MTSKFVLDYLRASLIGDDGNIINDLEFNPSDESLMEYLKVALSAIDGELTLEDIDEELLYPLALYAKKEIYTSLATKSAPLTDIKTQELELSLDQRFEHYYMLIKKTTDDLQLYLDNGGSFSVKAYDVTTRRMYYSNRNYNLAKAPKVTLRVDSETNDYVELSWSAKVDLFHSYELYAIEGENQKIVDIYNGNTINPNAKLLKTIHDYHNTKCRAYIKPPYTLTLLVKERNGLLGISSVTKGVVQDEI